MCERTSTAVVRWRRSHQALACSSLPSANEIRLRSAAKRTGGTSLGSPSTQTVRSLARGASCTPSTRFQATLSPPSPRPTPADQRQAVTRSW
jgi:hypothetical protein